MQKLLGFFTLIIAFLSLFTLNFISATCESGQIDINSATGGELDQLSGIGPAYAQRIIDDRPFSSVDDLLRVSGIGNATIIKIKSQGLACVENEEKQEETKEKVVEKNETIKEEVKGEATITGSTIQQEQREAITLNPLDTKAIKTDNGKDFQKNIAIYSLVVFCVLIGVLFFIRKDRYKNEFQ